MIFAYDVTLCIHNILPTVSHIMIKARDAMTFAYDT